MVQICKCAAGLDLPALLDAAPRDGVGARGYLCERCPTCGDYVEIILHPGRYEFGYTYAAGGPHFETMGEVAVKGLRIEADEPDDLTVRLGDRQWRFGIRRVGETSQRIDARMYACGRRIGELDLAQWGVELYAVRVGRAVEVAARDRIVEAGDDLLLRGPFPALRWAMGYLYSGRDREPGRKVV